MALADGSDAVTLLAEVTEFVGESLWTAIRAIEESAMLLDQMAREMEEKGGQSAASIGLLHDKSRDTLRRADTVRQVAISHQTLSQDNLAEVERTER